MKNVKYMDEENIIEKGTFEDRVWISGLIKLTAQELPVPKQKRRKTIGANQ